MAGKTNPGVEHRGDMGTVLLCLSPCFSTGMNKGTDTKGPSPQASVPASLVPASLQKILRDTLGKNENTSCSNIVLIKLM